MFDLLLNGATETAKSGLAILGAVLAVPGVIQCFFGYRVLKLYITVIGFLAGLLGFSIIGALASGSLAPGLLVGLLGGALLAFIAFKLHKLAVCLINGANAFLAVTVLGFASGVEYALRCLEPAAIQEHTGAGLIVGLAVGVIVAVLTAFLYRPVVILSTSLQGGVFLGYGLCMMLFALDIFPLVILVCTLLGAIFQFYNTRAEGRAAKEARRQEIMELQQEISLERSEALVGQELLVMIEGRLPEENAYVGRTYRDAPGVDGYIFIQTSRELMSGDFAQVRVTGALEYDLMGELSDESAE